MIYLSGKISDKTPEKEALNLMRFNRKATELRMLGLDVFNPIDHELSNQSWEFLLARDMDIIFSEEITGLYLMKGWKESKGALLERQACLRKQLKNPDFLIVEEQ